MYSGSTESFGKQWAVGDVVGVFLDLIDKTISKYQTELACVVAGTFFCEHFNLLTFQVFSTLIAFISSFRLAFGCNFSSSENPCP